MPHTYTHLAENTCLHIQIQTTLQITNEYRIECICANTYVLTYNILALRVVLLLSATAV